MGPATAVACGLETAKPPSPTSAVPRGAAAATPPGPAKAIAPGWACDMLGSVGVLGEGEAENLYSRKYLLETEGGESIPSMVLSLQQETQRNTLSELLNNLWGRLPWPELLVPGLDRAKKEYQASHSITRSFLRESTVNHARDETLQESRNLIPFRHSSALESIILLAI